MQDHQCEIKRKNSKKKISHFKYFPKNHFLPVENRFRNSDVKEAPCPILYLSGMSISKFSRHGRVAATPKKTQSLLYVTPN